LKKAHLNFTYNTANIGNDIFLDDQWISRPRYNGIGVGLGYETILGPIEMKYAYSPEVKNHLLWFTVGYKF
jgi:NTE family protein